MITKEQLAEWRELCEANAHEPWTDDAAKALPALLDEVEHLRGLLAAIVPSPRLVTQSPRGRDSTIRIVCDEPTDCWSKTIEAGLLYDANEALGRKLGQ
jgi:hypothetical protein